MGIGGLKYEIRRASEARARQKIRKAADLPIAYRFEKVSACRYEAPRGEGIEPRSHRNFSYLSPFYHPRQITMAADFSFLRRRMENTAIRKQEPAESRKSDAILLITFSLRIGVSLAIDGRIHRRQVFDSNRNRRPFFNLLDSRH